MTMRNDFSHNLGLLMQRVALGAAMTATVFGVGETVSAQDIEDFETEIHAAVTFTTGGTAFTTSGSVSVEDGVELYGSNTAGGDSSQIWLGTDYLVPATGSVGGFKVASSADGFRVVGLQAWTSINGGDNFAIGTVTFTGVRHDGTMVSEVVQVTPTSNSGAGYHTITFATLSGILFEELLVQLGNNAANTTPLNYIALDNIRLELRPADACATSPCMNGGSCASDEGEATCTCVTGTSGALCEVNDDDCAPNPCLNGGTCVDGLNAFVCDCATGFMGTTCEVMVLADAGVMSDAGITVDAGTTPRGGSSCTVGSGGSAWSSSVWLLGLVSVLLVRRRARR